MTDKTEHGVVLYCDGGSRPTSTGYGGYGIHGYTYNVKKVVKGDLEPSASGKPKPTQYGYVDPKLEFPKDTVLVEPVLIFDELKALGFEVTNNQAELSAAIRALGYANEQGVTKVHLLTDSKYTCVGATDHLPTWKAKNWRKSDGKEVKNIEYWKKLAEALDVLKAKDVEVELGYVPGHEDNPGNERADALATRGTYMSQNHQWVRRLVVTKEEPAKGYWGYDPKVSDFFTFSRCYFTTREPDRFSKDGRFVYYCGNTDRDNKGRLELGKRISDSAYSVIYLKAQDDAIEEMREHALKELEHDGTEVVYVAHLQNLHSKNYHRDIINGGTDFMLRATQVGKAVLLPLGGNKTVPMIESCSPPNLAWRAIESVNFLADRLNEFLEAERKSTDTLQVTDITDSLFTFGVDKKNKPIAKVSDKITPVVKSLKVDVNYKLNPEKAGVSPVVMTLGLDLPPRNNLNHLAAEGTKAYALTFKESDRAFRFAVVIERGEDVGIWSNVYSNPRILTE